MVLDVLTILEVLWEFFIEDRHSYGEDVHILIYVIVRFIIFVLIELLSTTMIVFWIESQSY